jgi:hypothetical protein
MQHARNCSHLLVCRLLLTALLACATDWAGAAVEIYSARLPVASRDAAVLRDARRLALESVIIKSSGVADVAALPAVRRALGNAQNYLLGYSYEAGADGELFLRFDFDEAAVQGILRDADLPLWTVNRPTVLAWVVISDGRERVFLSGSTTPDAHAALRSSFDRRGVPLQLPLLDLQDYAAISPGAAWRQVSADLIEASGRYRDRLILAGRIARLSGGRWTGDWRFFDQGRWVTRLVSEDSVGAFMDAGAALVAETLAQRYAVTLQAGADQRHRVSFRGVRRYADVRALQQALENLEAVRRVVPERLLGDSLSLRVDAEADLAQLARIIELDRRFVATPAPAGETGLHYEWIP